jgi:hypothetical protein
MPLLHAVGMQWPDGGLTWVALEDLPPPSSSWKPQPPHDRMVAIETNEQNGGLEPIERLF